MHQVSLFSVERFQQCLACLHVTMWSLMYLLDTSLLQWGQVSLSRPKCFSLTCRRQFFDSVKPLPHALQCQFVPSLAMQDETSAPAGHRLASQSPMDSDCSLQVVQSEVLYALWAILAWLPRDCLFLKVFPQNSHSTCCSIPLCLATMCLFASDF